MDAQATVSELQFVLARVLYAPHCDRERAVMLAKLAARTHPDPVKRAQMESWLAQREQPPIDDVVFEYLRRTFDVPEPSPADTLVEF